MRKYWRIYALMIFMIGISNPLLEIFYDSTINPFKAISPLPLIFSLGRNKTQKFSKIKIYLITKNDKVRFRFDRDFYHNLPGPHRYKLLFLTKIFSTNFIYYQNSFVFLNKIFCEQYIPLKDVHNKKVKAIEIKQRRSNKQILYWKCPT